MAIRHIADPVHGAIDLDDVEFDIIDTPTFQRLRRIKQLAMVSQVYPGADHSRFVHSLGVFSVMARILHRLQELHPDLVKDDDVRKLRLAALLHDVGHYPYSHLMERVKLPGAGGGDFQAAVKAKPGRPHAEATQAHFPTHEELGAMIVEKRQDIVSVLRAHNYEPAEIASIVTHRHHCGFYNQLSSRGLDADRIDYMLRDAHYTGVPYGGIDIEYILRNIDFDEDQNICITSKAILSTEHFLLGRWYNYGAVVFQKTVMGMEELMRRLLERMVKRRKLPRDPETIQQMVPTDSFLTFDDHYVDAKIRSLASKGVRAAGKDGRTGATDTLLAQAVLHRVKPRCVFEGFQEPGSDRVTRELEVFDGQVPKQLEEWANRFQVPRECWFLADSTPRYLEEVRRYGTFTDELEDLEGPGKDRARKIQKLMRVRQPDGSSAFLADWPSGLVHYLSKAIFRVARVYVLLPDEVAAAQAPPAKAGWRRQFKQQAEAIRDHILKDLRLSG